jgi:hypothetical protein
MEQVEIGDGTVYDNVRRRRRRSIRVAVYHQITDEVFNPNIWMKT